MAGTWSKLRERWIEWKTGRGRASKPPTRKTNAVWPASSKPDIAPIIQTDCAQSPLPYPALHFLLPCSPSWGCFSFLFKFKSNICHNLQVSAAARKRAQVQIRALFLSKRKGAKQMSCKKQRGRRREREGLGVAWERLNIFGHISYLILENPIKS